MKGIAMIRASHAPAPHLVEPTLDTLEEDHVIQQILCRDLEALADGLPGLPSLADIRRLCDRIIRVVDTHFDRAEKVFAELQADRRPSDNDRAMLRSMHMLDAMHGHDLIVALWQHTAQADQYGVGELSYMLRCFFDGCRRAIMLKESWRDAAQRTAVMSD
jgi:hypothetical protein